MFRDVVIRYQLSGFDEPLHEDSFKKFKNILLSHERRDNDRKLIGMLRDTLITEDRFEGVRVISPSEAIQFYMNPESSFLYAYVGQKNGQTWLRVRFRYGAPKWLFATRFVALAGDQPYDSPSLDFVRDNNAKGVWEEVDPLVDEELLALLYKIANSDDVVIRYYGRDSTSDHKVGAQHKQALADILELYELLKQL